MPWMCQQPVYCPGSSVGAFPPEAPGSWAQAGRVPALLVRDALRTAEMLRKEMQLVGGGLVRQLVQALLGG